MRSNMVRAILGVALAAAVLLLIVLTGGDERMGNETSPANEPNPPPRDQQPRKPATPTIVVKGGKPRGGVEELSFGRGDRVRFKVTSDVEDEVHLHGYDISKEVEAGGAVSFDFPAELEGIFEVELEHRAEPIAELRVNP